VTSTTIAEALRDALREEMTIDDRVFCLGEDIGISGGWGGAFTVTLGLEKLFRDRIIDTPLMGSCSVPLSCSSYFVAQSAAVESAVRPTPVAP